MMTSLLLGMLTVFRAFLPLCPPVGDSAVIVQVVVGDDLLGYQFFYLVRFAPVAPLSSSAAG